MPAARHSPGAAGFLSLGAEDGITAAHVGHHGVGAAGIVAERHYVVFAGAAAVFVARAGGKETAEDAVFRMEDRQVLVHDCFDPVAAHGTRQIGQLLGVEIVGGGERDESQSQEFVGGTNVCSVQTEIAGEIAMRAISQEVQQAGGAHQDGAIAAQKEIDDAFLRPV